MSISQKGQTKQSSPTSSEPTSDYVPQVGDEVELKWNGNPQKGLIYNSEAYSCGVSVMHVNATEPNSRFHYCRADYENFTDMRKVGHFDSVPCWPVDFDTAKEFSKAYFATAKATFTHDPDKSYAENQAAWVKFHGLEEGSKVRMVKPCEVDEDGSNCSRHGQFELDDAGESATIRNFEKRNVNISNSVSCCWSVPYFALEPVK